MKVSIWSASKCWEAQYLLDKVSSYLLLNDFTIESDTRLSDCIILNTCNSLFSFDKANLDIINNNISKNIFVIWCGAKFYSAKKNIVLIKVWDESLLDQFFFKNIRISEVTSHHVQKLRNNDIFVTIEVSRWCNHGRNYCWVHMWIDKVKSKTIKDIISEIDVMKKCWIKRIVFSSDDLWSYGQDIGVNFLDLLKEISKRKYDFSFEFNYIDPRFIVKYIEDLLRYSEDWIKIDKMLVPIYDYNSKDFGNINITDILESVKRLRNRGITLYNHIIVLKPDETYDEFTKNLGLVKLYDHTTFNLFYEKEGLWRFKKIINYNDKSTYKKLSVLMKLTKKYPEQVSLEERMSKVYNLINDKKISHSLWKKQ